MSRLATPTLLLLVGALAFAGCAGKNDRTFVTLDTSKGRIVLELYDDKAPITVANFKKYVQEGFYDNTVFHRIVKDFMIQGGGVDAVSGEQKEGSHPAIKNEARVSGLKNEKYTIAMARLGPPCAGCPDRPDTATSQFFINTHRNVALDATDSSFGYAVFGKVVQGQEVVDAIEDTPTTAYQPGRFCLGAGSTEKSCPTQKIVLHNAVLGKLGPADAPTTSVSPSASVSPTSVATTPSS